MKITTQEVGYIAHLARLDFSESEKGKLTTQLNTILMYMEMLNRIDTTRIKPATNAVSLDNVFREDTEQKSTGVKIALADAPDGTMGLFGVPRVLE